MNGLISHGSWQEVKSLRRGKKKQGGPLNDINGQAVFSHDLAETFAKHLEEVQWVSRPCASHHSDILIGNMLQVLDTDPDEQEVIQAMRKLKNGKASGIDEVPAESWKALLADSEAIAIIQNFCSACWQARSIPENWHKVLVTCIYKKGTPKIVRTIVRYHYYALDIKF